MLKIPGPWLRSGLHADKLRGGLFVSMWLDRFGRQSQPEKDPGISSARAGKFNNFHYHLFDHSMAIAKIDTSSNGPLG
jgi:hypothetical protein